MHHVKSEHEKDDDDDLDDDRKPELGHHGHHSYYQHPMPMSGHYNNTHQHHHSLKTEIETISKNQTGSGCGVPIPASKPKIWSLADTAACKTPPPHLHPSAGAWGYQTTHQHQSQQPYSNHTELPTLNHQHQMHRQHQSQYLLQEQQQQVQQHHMEMTMQAANGADTAAGMNMNMITSGHPNQSMSGMMNTFGGSSPYSRYGGFLTTGTHPIQQQAAQQIPQAQHQYINHSHTGGSTTPVTPNSIGQPTTPTLQQQNNSNQTSSNQTMGFPEVQTGKHKLNIFWFCPLKIIIFSTVNLSQTPRHKLHRI